MENNKNIDEIEFVDAVLPIPKNAVEIHMDVNIFEDGRLQELGADFDMQDIRDSIDRFEKTVAGEYPKYCIAEEGLKWLEEHKNEQLR